MRGLTILAAAIAGILINGSAQTKIQLAQSSTTTNCMGVCNTQFVTCQSSCISTGSTPQVGAAASTFNASPSASCIQSCTTQQLACQLVCARASPSQ